MGRRRRAKVDLTVYEAEIVELSHEGRGIAKVEGKTTFIHGALPGERVKYQIIEKKRAYDVAKVVEVISASPDRIEPICPHFELCGGCSLQHVSLKQQVALKETGLKEQFQHFARVEPDEWLSPIESQTEGYRHKARLSVRHVFKKEKVLIGFRERFCGRFIVDMDDCKILHPQVATNLPNLEALVESLEKSESIAQIEVAIGDQQAALIFRNLEPLSEQDEQRLKSFAESKSFTIYLQPKGPDSVYKLYPEGEIQKLNYRLDDFDLSLEFEPTDFTQVNPYINRKMVRKAIDLLSLSGDETVLDLFCGLGNFSLAIARHAKKIIGVEGSELMVKRARENATLNNISNAEFHAFDLTEDFTKATWNQSIDKLLIDPPRSGAKEIVSQIEKLSPNTIVYVACSPSTLARDAGILVHEKGYRLVKAGVLDMFPHTSHIESIALFVRTDA
jgi:23S rRNA (uracil1939-C5)-methyltransferase